jgi:hypothetical protein
MKNLKRQISIVKSILERAETIQSIARLTSLLISLQNEYIVELEKNACATNKRKVA